FPERDVFQFGSVHQFSRAIDGRFSGEYLRNTRIISAELRCHVGERVSQLYDFKIVIDWLRSKELELERFLVAVPKFRKSLAVWFRHFVAMTQDTARKLKQRAVERARR